MNRFLICIVLLCAVSTYGFAQDSASIALKYRKSEYRIPMRDGVKLFTTVYSPRDSTRTYPMLMLRTPYGVGPYGHTKYPHWIGPSHRFAEEGFIFVYQDVRGRYMSEGEFENVTPARQITGKRLDVDESTDGYDTIEWLLHHVPHNNGAVGMWGVSYPGFYTTASSINAHPALKAISPQAPIADWYMGDDVHHHGAFFLLDNFGFSSGFDRTRNGPSENGLPGFTFPTLDAYSFFLHAGPIASCNERYFDRQVPYWDSLVAHPRYDDYWRRRNILPRLLNMPPAVLVVGGWFDAEDLYGTLHSFAAIRHQNPESATSLVMGPWFHGGWEWTDGASLGDIFFGSQTARYFRDSLELPFFLHYLKGEELPTISDIRVFETGSNTWCSYPAWPPKHARAQSLFLAADGQLVFSQADPGLNGFDEFVSDPTKPVPYDPGILNWRTAENAIADQRFASCRTDVLSFETEPLKHSLTAAGPINVHLTVSTTGTDADWVVKVIDVYPDTCSNPDHESSEYHLTGYQMLVRQDIMPSRFRNGFDREEPMAPGVIVPIAFAMNDVNHSFLAGHRIMVQVQCSLYPLVERNPQQFLPMYHANQEDMRTALQRVYHQKSDLSWIELNVLPERPR